MSPNNMTDAVKSKTKEVRINTENLTFIAGLNGLQVIHIAQRLECSNTMIWQAVKRPEEYPSVYLKICALLPRRAVNE